MSLSYGAFRALSLLDVICSDRLAVGQTMGLLMGLRVAFGMF